MVTASDHVAISRRFIRQAEEELEDGDLLQASEKAWGAVVHRLKAMAQQRGWRHGSHRHYYTIATQLGQETDRALELERLLTGADGLHANFYNAHMIESEVRDGMERVKVLLAVLDQIA